MKTAIASFIIFFISLMVMWAEPDTVIGSIAGITGALSASASVIASVFSNPQK